MISRTRIRIALGITAGALLFWTASAQQQQAKPGDLGFTDTPILPGMKWHVHDPDRPHPPVVTPGATPYAPPSDAVVLFDGKDLSKWGQMGKGADANKMIAPTWPVKDGYFECAGNGDLITKEKFGDIQLHVEWSEPADVKGTSQGRGNSGILIMSRYELQVLDAFKNPTYADGQAGAIYGQWPPLANPGASSGAVADLRHRVRGAALRGRKAGEAGLSDAVHEQRADAQSQGSDGRDGLPQGRDLLGARSRRAPGAAGPSQSGALPQYLVAAFASLR